MSVRRGLVFSGLFLTLAAGPAAGQTTFATITGQVTDSAGGVIPGAVVEARHLLSNYTYTTTTNEIGHYILGSRIGRRARGDRTGVPGRSGSRSRSSETSGHAAWPLSLEYARGRSGQTAGRDSRSARASSD